MIEGGEEYTYTGARSIDHKSIDEKEREKEREKENGRNDLYGYWLRTTDIDFLFGQCRFI